MKKRLRKKLHLREFKEFGFTVYFRTKGGWNKDTGASPEFDVFYDKFCSYADSQSLIFGGGGSIPWGGWHVTACTLNHCKYCHRHGRVYVTEKTRSDMIEFLKTIPELVNFVVGPLSDCNYGPFDERTPQEAISEQLTLSA